ncbi:MAG: Hpt domain-containing protein [Burkholderiales bacterium]
MDETVIDKAAFAELVQTAGAEFVRELIDTFLIEAPAMLAALDRALADRDAGDFRRAAHSLKSNGNTFGARTLGALARDLELSGLEPVVAAGGAPIVALRAEYDRVAASLAELRDA